jgi:hypothetical protein
MNQGNSGMWLAVLLAFVLGTGVGNIFSVLAVNPAVYEQAIVEAERARRNADSLAAEAWSFYTALGDTLLLVRDSVALQRTRASVEAQRASQRFSSLQAQAGSRAGDSAQVVALVDSLATAHSEQVDALESEVRAVDRERAVLWKRVESDSTLIYAQLGQINALQVERDLQRGLAKAWEAKANPGWVKRLEQGAPILGIGLVTGITLTLLAVR